MIRSLVIAEPLARERGVSVRISPLGRTVYINSGDDVSGAVWVYLRSKMFLAGTSKPDTDTTVQSWSMRQMIEVLPSSRAQGREGRE